ncbi:MAG: ABC transporter substrate-binding protein [Candidatus Bathyarchaeia archaeon]
MSEGKKVSRRRFVKYVGGAAGIAALAAVGYGVYETTKPAPVTPTNSTSMATSMASALSGGTIVIDEPTTPATIDPGVADTTPSEESVFMVYQALVAYKDDSGSTIVPLLAESLPDISPDGTVFTFKVRQGVHFSNGDPLNAYCVWYSHYRSGVMNRTPGYQLTVPLGNFPKTDGVTDTMLNEWTNSDNTPPSDQLALVTSGKISFTCPDPYTFVARVPSPPFAAFLPIMTQQGSLVVDPRWVSANGGVTAGATNPYVTLHALGSGPFTITDFEPGVKTVYEKDPNYWGGPGTGVHAPAKLDKLIITEVPDDLTRLGDVEKGTAQISFVDPSIIETIAGSTYIPTFGRNVYVAAVQLNTTRAPFNNKLVRQAVVRAVDYDAIIGLSHGLAEKFQMPIPNGVPGQDTSVLPYPYDPTTAKSLLAQAGFPGGNGIPEVSLLFMTNRPLQDRASEIIQSNLADIGITAKLIGLPRSTVGAVVGNTSIDPTDRNTYYDMIWTSWSWFPDPWCFADWFVGKLGFYGEGNDGFYSTPAVEALLAKADVAVSMTDRANLYAQITAIVYDDAPDIPAVQFSAVFATGAPICNVKLQGFSMTMNSQGSANFTNCYLTS